MKDAVTYIKFMGVWLLSCFIWGGIIHFAGTDWAIVVLGTKTLIILYCLFEYDRRKAAKVQCPNCRQYHNLRDLPLE
jgi:hypothetical protein